MLTGVTVDIKEKNTYVGDATIKSPVLGANIAFYAEISKEKRIFTGISGNSALNGFLGMI
jgi:hypothetical protein